MRNDSHGRHGSRATISSTLYSPDEGSYTFTVSDSGYRDDHGDDEENATVLEFGETVSGVIRF